MRSMAKFAVLGALLLLGGCVSMPSGPGVMALPGTGKNFDQFRAEDMDCRQYASNQVGGTTPDGAAADSMVRSAALGTLIGAVFGAAAGGHNATANGAATGLFFGTAVGAAAGSGSQYTLQQRYDISYTQCMYSKGHKIPSAARYETTRHPVSSYTPPPPPPRGADAPPSATTAIAPPPPPPGTPPPPPPGVN